MPNYQDIIQQLKSTPVQSPTSSPRHANPAATPLVQPHHLGDLFQEQAAPDTTYMWPAPSSVATKARFGFDLQSSHPPSATPSGSPRSPRKVDKQHSAEQAHELVSQAGKDITDALLQRGKTAGRVATFLGTTVGLLGTAAILAGVFLTGVAGLAMLTQPQFAIPIAVGPVALGIIIGVALRMRSRRNLANNVSVQAKVDALCQLQKNLQKLDQPNDGEKNLLKHTEAVLHRLHMLGVPMENDSRSSLRQAAGRAKAPLRDALRLAFFDPWANPLSATIYGVVHFLSQNGGGNGSHGGLHPATAAPYYGWGWGAKNPFVSQRRAQANLLARNTAAQLTLSPAAQLTDEQLKALDSKVSPTS